VKRMRHDHGSVTQWMLGLTVMMLFIGGIALDLWRGFSERRALAGIADGAAVAGANGVDVAYFRSTTQVRLSPVLAEQLARQNLASQLDDRSLVAADVSATPDVVAVTVTGQVDFTLLRVLMGGDDFEVTVLATAEPRPSP
jgi:Putative Flp pilus-assembly TadE/G-like